MIDAKYTVAELEEYRGNPLIEALPPIPNESDLLTLNRYPLYSSTERALPSTVRLHCLDRLWDLFQAQPQHFDVCIAISRLIRAGYKSRNPMSFAKEVNLLAHSLANAGSLSAIKPSDEYAQCRSAAYLIGISGMGKTSVLERVVSRYPQVIRHNNYHGAPFTQTQVVYG